MQALAASCEELRARTGKPPLLTHLLVFLWQTLSIYICSDGLYKPQSTAISNMFSILQISICFQSFKFHRRIGITPIVLSFRKIKTIFINYIKYVLAKLRKPQPITHAMAISSNFKSCLYGNVPSSTSLCHNMTIIYNRLFKQSLACLLLWSSPWWNTFDIRKRNNNDFVIEFIFC
jgi:hypothetical protein